MNAVTPYVSEIYVVFQEKKDICKKRKDKMVSDHKAYIKNIYICAYLCSVIKTWP